MTEPRTKAGRRLLKLLEALPDWEFANDWCALIQAIEDEAVLTLHTKLEGTFVVTQDGTLVEAPELEWLTRVGPGHEQMGKDLAS